MGFFKKITSFFFRLALSNIMEAKADSIEALEISRLESEIEDFENRRDSNLGLIVKLENENTFLRASISQRESLVVINKENSTEGVNHLLELDRLKKLARRDDVICNNQISISNSKSDLDNIEIETCYWNNLADSSSNTNKKLFDMLNFLATSKHLYFLFINFEKCMKKKINLSLMKMDIPDNNNFDNFVNGKSPTPFHIMSLINGYSKMCFKEYGIIPSRFFLLENRREILILEKRKNILSSPDNCVFCGLTMNLSSICNKFIFRAALGSINLFNLKKGLLCHNCYKMIEVNGVKEII